MATDRPPAFRFYPKDWRDVKVRRMSLAAQGAYLSILCDMWIDSKDQCSLLDCDPFIAKSLGVTEDDWLVLRAEIQHEHEPLLIVKDGRLYSMRLRDEGIRQRKYAQTQAESGRRGAEARIKRALNEPSTTGQAKSSSSSSSSSSSLRVRKKKKETRAMPENWSLTETITEYGLKKGMTPVTLQHQFEHCKTHHAEKRWTEKGWDSQVWQTWVLNWISFGAKQVTPQSVPPPQAKCAYANIRCESDAVPGSKYCLAHKTLIQRQQATIKPGPVVGLLQDVKDGVKQMVETVLHGKTIPSGA